MSECIEAISLVVYFSIFKHVNCSWLEISNRQKWLVTKLQHLLYEEFSYTKGAASPGHAAIVTDRILKIWFPGSRNQPKNWLKASWTRLFFIFCQIFDISDYFSKWSTSEDCETLKIIKYAKINWRKVLFNLPLTHFLANSG